MNCFRWERRKHRRYQVELNVTYNVCGPKFVTDILGQREYVGRTMNLSEGGVAVKIGHYLPAGTLIRIKMVVTEWNKFCDARCYEPVQVLCEVRSVGYLSEGCYRLGLAFKTLTVHQRQVIRNLQGSRLRSEAETTLQE